MRVFLVLVSALLVVSCGSEDDPASTGAGGLGGAGAPRGEGGENTGATGGGGEASGEVGGGGIGPCPSTMTCVDSFPFHDERDTTTEGQSLIDVYGCKPTADESGSEIYYRVSLPGPGQLTATITDGVGVDIDVHVLTSIKNGQCIARDDVTVTTTVLPPYVYVSADTFVVAGVPQAGPFSLDVDFVPSR